MERGFTLVELLAVVVVLAVVMVIASYSVVSIRDDINAEELETKLGSIRDSAILLGQENMNGFDGSCTITVNCKEETFSYCKTLTVQELLDDGYLEIKNDEKQYINPVSGKDMKDDEVTIYRKNNRVYATLTNIISCAGVCDEAWKGNCSADGGA